MCFGERGKGKNANKANEKKRQQQFFCARKILSRHGLKTDRGDGNMEVSYSQAFFKEARLFLANSIKTGISEAKIIPKTAYSKLFLIIDKPPKKYPAKVKDVTHKNPPVMLKSRNVG